jgi:hypothetical protein
MHDKYSRTLDSAITRMGYLSLCGRGPDDRRSGPCSCIAARARPRDPERRDFSLQSVHPQFLNVVLKFINSR